MKLLPVRPNLPFLRREARRLHRRVRGNDATALALARHFDRGFAAPTAAPEAFRLADAQRIVARGYGFGSWARLASHVERAATADRAPLDPALARLLRSLHGESLEAVDRVRATGDRFDPRSVALQARAARALDAVFETHGWPTVSLVGPEPFAATFEIVGNAATQGLFNRRAMPRLAARVRRGEAPARWLAQLLDRADCLAGRPVRYGLVGDFDERGRFGTGHDVVDPANLDVRRAGMGLEPIEAQRRRCAEEARARGEDPSVDREAYEAERLELGRRGGWR